jgi:hypothetical protein
MKEIIVIEGEEIMCTHKAVLWDSDDYGEIWVPLSVIEYKDEDSLEVQEWWFKKKGF